MPKWHQLGNLVFPIHPSHRRAFTTEDALHCIMTVCGSMRALARAGVVKGPCHRMWAVHQQLRMFGVCRRYGGSGGLAAAAAAAPPGRASLACAASTAAADAAPSSSKQKVRALKVCHVMFLLYCNTSVRVG